MDTQRFGLLGRPDVVGRSGLRPRPTCHVRGVLAAVPRVFRPTTKTPASCRLRLRGPDDVMALYGTAYRRCEVARGPSASCLLMWEAADTVSDVAALPTRDAHITVRPPRPS